MARNEYAPKKKSRNGNRSDHGRPERGEKRQRPAREHVEREGVQEVVDFVFGRHAVVEALQTPDRVNRVFIQEGTSGRDAATVSYTHLTLPTNREHSSSNRSKDKD